MKKNVKNKHLSLRIDEELLAKFGYMAEKQERSMNWMITNLIRKSVSSYEERFGAIVLEDEAPDEEE